MSCISFPSLCPFCSTMLPTVFTEFGSISNVGMSCMSWASLTEYWLDAQGCTISAKRNVTKERNIETAISGRYTCDSDIPELRMARSSFDDPRSPSIIEEAARDANGKV